MISFIKQLFFTNAFAESLLKKLGRNDSFFQKFYPSNKHYSKSSFRYCENAGVRFKLDISDYQEYLVYFNLEQDSSRPILDYIPKTAKVILDIGANIGQTSLWVANEFKSMAPSIYAFEPFPDTFEKCQINVGLNDFQGIHIQNIALGNSEKTLNMIKHSQSNSGGFRAKGGYDSDLPSVEVNQTTLDNFWAGKEEGIDFVKIDVEGYEMEVIKGGENTIAKYKPVMVLEVNDSNLKAQKSSALELFRFLKNELGYDDFRNILNQEILREDDFKECCFDLLVSKAVKG